MTSRAVVRIVLGGVVAAIVQLAVFAAAAGAQTVIVRRAPSGATVEVAINATLAGSAEADADGRATVAVSREASITADMPARISVDVCDTRRRVNVVDGTARGLPPDPGCVRQDVSGIFVVRAISTLVVDLYPEGPTLLLIQGRFNPDAPPKTWAGAPTGFVVFGGGGLTSFADTGVNACGTVSTCNQDGMGLGYQAGAAFWLKPFLGGEIAYVAPADPTVEGAGPTYRFDSALDARVVTAAGLLGVPVGPVRFFGKVGANYHQATFSTTQTIEPATLVIDEATIQVPGSTQTLEHRTGGWGWLFGGGMDVWLSRWFGVYGEFSFAKIKGTDLDDGEAEIEDRLSTIMVGARVRIGR